MTDASLTRTDMSRGHYFPVSGARMSLLLAMASVGAIASSSSHATALTVTGPALYYANYGPNPAVPNGGLVGQYIAYSAESVVPNGAAGTTGVATTTNQNTQSTITRPINFTPGPIDPNLFFGTLLLCTTTNNCTSPGNNNPNNLTGPWTLTFQNTGTTPTSASNTLSLVGPGEIGFPQNITLSGTSTNPTFSWSAPPGPTPDGYRIVIYQNNIIGPGNNGQVAAKNLTQPTYTVKASDFTVPGYQLMPNTTYTIELENLVTRDGSTTNLGNPNLSAASRVFTSFQILPAGTPLVNLPTFTSVGNQITYGFQLTVQPGITYYIDPAVATGYIYKTGAGNSNFASVKLPDIGNPNPYDLYLWNGSAFVFDTTLAANTVFDFATGGVSEFEVLGIDPESRARPQQHDRLYYRFNVRERRQLHRHHDTGYSRRHWRARARLARSARLWLVWIWRDPPAAPAIVSKFDASYLGHAGGAETASTIMKS